MYSKIGGKISPPEMVILKASETVLYLTNEILP